MPTLVKLTRAGHVTLPKAIREKANLQPGDVLEVALDRKGRVVLIPKRLRDSNQAWYWTPEWQAMEREADEDIKAGRVTTFSSAAEAIEYLRSRG